LEERDKNFQKQIKEKDILEEEIKKHKRIIEENKKKLKEIKKILLGRERICEEIDKIKEHEKKISKEAMQVIRAMDQHGSHKDNIINKMKEENEPEEIITDEDTLQKVVNRYSI